MRMRIDRNTQKYITALLLSISLHAFQERFVWQCNFSLKKIKAKHNSSYTAVYVCKQISFLVTALGYTCLSNSWIRFFFICFTHPPTSDRSSLWGPPLFGKGRRGIFAAALSCCSLNKRFRFLLQSSWQSCQVGSCGAGILIYRESGMYFTNKILIEK